MRHLPSLAAVRAFEAAARHKNYTRAGDELGLTQAAVSYQIKSLEQRIGTVLFVRAGRMMELTPAGAALAPRIAQAFSIMETAFRELGESENSILSIACFQTYASKILAPRLGSFQLAHPDIAVRLVVGDEYADLEAGECDVALRLSHDVAPGLVAQDLNPLELAPFASREFIARQPALQGEDPLIPVDLRLSPTFSWWNAWDAAHRDTRTPCDPEHVSPRGLQFDSQLLDAAAAMSGNGVAILANSLFRDEIASGRLVAIGRSVVTTGARFRLVYPHARRLSPKVRAFRLWLEQEIATSAIPS